MESGPPRWHLLEAIINLLVAVLIIVVGKEIEDLTLHRVIESATLIFTVILLSAGTATAIATYTFHHRTLSDLRHIQQAVVSLAASRSINDAFMAEHEKSCACKEIWIVSPDLHKDIELSTASHCFREVVADNIRHRGLTYTYVVPEIPDNILRVNSLWAPYTPDERSRLHIYRLPSDRWRLLPYIDGDLIIYNPRALIGGGPTEGYYELPIRDRDQWVRLDDKTVINWAGRVTQVLNEAPASARCDPGSI